MQVVRALLIVLPYGRHCFGWPLVQQTLAVSVVCLEATWRSFKGWSFQSLDDFREQAEHWCAGVAGLRVHGTTRQLPREIFEAEEQAKLQPYDGVIYDVSQWKEVTVHPDHHVSFGQALYSAPTTSCPPRTKLEIRGDSGLVKLYRKGKLVKVHPRQQRGVRATDPTTSPLRRWSTPFVLPTVSSAGPLSSIPTSKPSR